VRAALCVVIAVLAVVAGYVRVTASSLALDVSSARFASPSAAPVCEERDVAPNLTDVVNGVGLVLAARPPTEAETIAAPRVRAAAPCSAGVTAGASASPVSFRRVATTTPPRRARLQASSPARDRARLMVFLI
jgi:hypothetical protein